MFLSAHETFMKIAPILNSKVNPTIGQGIELAQTIFSDHYTIKLEINKNIKKQKDLSTWKFQNILLNNSWFKSEYGTELQNFFKITIMKT